MTLKAFYWPTVTERRIIEAYDTRTGKLVIHARHSSPILAVTEGRITAVTDTGLQLQTKQVVITYGGLQNVSVQPGDAVNDGDEIAEAGADERITLAVYRVVDPTEMFEPQAEETLLAADEDQQPEEAESPEEAPIYLTPVRDDLHVREEPVDGQIIGTLQPGEIVQSLESAEDTDDKVGVMDEWLHIRRADGTAAYAAAWLLEKAAKE